MHEGEDRLPHLGGKGGILGLKPSEHLIAGLRARDVQNGANPLNRAIVEGPGRLGVKLRHQRGPDPAHGFRVDISGQRHRIGDPPRLFARQLAQKLSRAGNGQLGQHHGGHLDAFLLQDRDQPIQRQGGQPVPRVGLGAGPSQTAQAAGGIGRDMAIHHLQGPFNAAGEGEPHLLQLVQELLNHLCQRGAVDKPHLADLFSQGGLHVIRQLGQRQNRTFRQKKPHDYGSLFARRQGAGRGRARHSGRAAGLRGLRQRCATALRAERCDLIACHPNPLAVSQHGGRLAGPD